MPNVLLFSQKRQVIKITEQRGPVLTTLRDMPGCAVHLGRKSLLQRNRMKLKS